MKVFISLPMKDKTEQEVLEARKKAQEEITEYLHDDDLYFIDTWIAEDPPEDVVNKGPWFLGKSLEMMAGADIVYCAQSWASFRGCKIEYAAAKNYGIKVVTYADYLTSKGYLK